MRKVYGSYQTVLCPFCQKQAVAKNDQDVPVCIAHKKSVLENIKCPCGDWLDVRSGKYGVYGSCLRCGNVNLNRALAFTKSLPPSFAKSPLPKPQIRADSDPKKQEKSDPEPKKEIIIRSDEVDFYFG